MWALLSCHALADSLSNGGIAKLASQPTVVTLSLPRRYCIAVCLGNCAFAVALLRGSVVSETSWCAILGAIYHACAVYSVVTVVPIRLSCLHRQV